MSRLAIGLRQGSGPAQLEFTDDRFSYVAPTIDFKR